MDYELSGELSESIGNLDNLTSLRLTGNQLSGEIPLGIGNLSNLITLKLSMNQFTGDIPSEICDLGGVETLYFSHNQLSGEIPECIGDLINLTQMFLHYNQLTGSIPNGIGNLENLQYYLYLQHNELTSIPESICEIYSNITNFIIDNNNLCPPYPDCLTEEDIGDQDTSECEESVTDIDGNTYEIVQIGDQVWMAENLKVTHYNNGDEIQTGYADEVWAELETGANANYNDDPANADIYGHLYNWFAVDDSRGLCIEGFHVPSDEEWTILTVYLGGIDVAGGKMKEEGTEHWNSPNTGATNESNFTSLPGGYRNGNTGNFGMMGHFGSFWSSSDYYDGNYAWYRTLYYDKSIVYRASNNLQAGKYIRCLKE